MKVPGIGIISSVLGVVPIAYFIISPFALGRGNMAWNRVFAVNKYYYRRMWQQILFGKYWKILGVVGFFSILRNQQIKDRKNRYYYHTLFAPIEEYTDDYDEEGSYQSKLALARYRLEKSHRSQIENYKKEKAEKIYKAKSEAFDNIISKYSQI